MSALAYVRCVVMPREQPLAQDLMQEALSSSGSHVERFLSPTIFSGVLTNLYSTGCMRAQVYRPVKWSERTEGEMCVSVHLNSLIFDSECNHSHLCKSGVRPNEQNWLNWTFVAASKMLIGVTSVCIRAYHIYINMYTSALPHVTKLFPQTLSNHQC